MPDSPTFPPSEQFAFRDPGYRGRGGSLNPSARPGPGPSPPTNPKTRHQLSGKTPSGLTEAASLLPFPSAAGPRGATGGREEAGSPRTAPLTSSHHPVWALSPLPRTDRGQEGDRLRRAQGTARGLGPPQAPPGVPHASSAAGGAPCREIRGPISKHLVPIPAPPPTSQADEVSALPGPGFPHP